MKEYAKTKDYIEYLEQKLKEAEKEQLEYIDIIAKDLHAKVSEKPTLPTCCSAMRRIMREGDKILKDTDNVSKSSIRLKIRYFIKDREEKAFTNPPKRRGRPAGYRKEEQLRSSNREKRPLSLEAAAVSHLEECDISFEVRDHLILAHGEYGVWKIHIDHGKKGTKADMAKKIYDMLTEFDDTVEKTSLLIMSNQRYEKEWLKISDSVKQRLNLTLLKCTPHGKIKEI